MSVGPNKKALFKHGEKIAIVDSEQSSRFLISLILQAKLTGHSIKKLQ